MMALAHASVEERQPEKSGADRHRTRYQLIPADTPDRCPETRPAGRLPLAGKPPPDPNSA